MVNVGADSLSCDQTIALAGVKASKDYPSHLRRIRFIDPESGKTLVFLSNDFQLPALTIWTLYKSHWQVELLFKWIKWHLCIKQFYGTSANAVKTQIWIAASVFEKTQLQQAFTGNSIASKQNIFSNQLNLFSF